MAKMGGTSLYAHMPCFLPRGAGSWQASQPVVGYTHVTVQHSQLPQPQYGIRYDDRAGTCLHGQPPSLQLAGRHYVCLLNCTVLCLNSCRPGPSHIACVLHNGSDHKHKAQAVQVCNSCWNSAAECCTIIESHVTVTGCLNMSYMLPSSTCLITSIASCNGTLHPLTKQRSCHSGRRPGAR